MRQLLIRRSRSRSEKTIADWAFALDCNLAGNCLPGLIFFSREHYIHGAPEAFTRVLNFGFRSTSVTATIPSTAISPPSQSAPAPPQSISPPAHSAPPQQSPQPATVQRARFPRLKYWGSLSAIALALILLLAWWSYGGNRSVTEDAFVEAHIINVAPQAVSGHLVSFFVEENDRVEKDQVLAEIDSESYRDQVDLARRKVEAAEAELKRQETALARLRLEVPLQIEIARRTLAAAKADEARA